MARPHKFRERWRSVTGGTLIGLGLHLLSGNLDKTAGQIRHVLDTASEEALGVLPSIVLATSQAGNAYALDRHQFWLGLLPVLVPFWPLLLVIAGAVLLRDVVTEKAKGLPSTTKFFQNEHTRCRFRCPSFDA